MSCRQVETLQGMRLSEHALRAHMCQACAVSVYPTPDTQDIRTALCSQRCLVCSGQLPTRSFSQSCRAGGASASDGAPTSDISQALQSSMIEMQYL